MKAKKLAAESKNEEKTQAGDEAPADMLASAEDEDIIF